MPGGYLGGVYRVGSTGWVIRGPAASPPIAGERSICSEAGPGSPTGAGVGGRWSSGVTVGGDGLFPTPAGPGRSLWALPGNTPWNAHLGPIRRDFTSFLIKLVKTAKCHQNSSKRPVIVPISKTGSRNHLLKFSGFRFLQPSLTRN